MVRDYLTSLFKTIIGAEREKGVLADPAVGESAKCSFAMPTHKKTEKT